MNPTNSQFPTSHVKISPREDRGVFNQGTEDEYDDVSGRVKYKADAYRKNSITTDEFAAEDKYKSDSKTRHINKKLRSEGKTPVVKIDSSK